MSVSDLLSQQSVPAEANLENVQLYGDQILAQLDHAKLAEDARNASRLAPEFIALTEALLRSGHLLSKELSAIAGSVLATVHPPLVFLDTIDVLLCCPLLLAEHGRHLNMNLNDWFTRARLDGKGLRAYDYLESMTRLALSGASREFLLLENLLSLTIHDPVELVERAPRLIGIAAERWHTEGTQQLLTNLIEIPDAASDCLFELALADLREGLQQSNSVDARAAFSRAHDHFADAEGLEEARDDATIYRCAMDAVLLFGSVSDREAVVQVANDLDSACQRRRAWTMSTSRPWSRPSRQSEYEWAVLASTLRKSAEPLKRPSWLNPAETLAQVLRAYRASRSLTTVACTSGLEVIVEPVIEGAFIRREGLLAHLEELASLGEMNTEESQAVEALLTTVRTAPNPNESCDEVGKALEVAPDLVRELGVASGADIASLSRDHPGLLNMLELAARQRRSAELRVVDPVVERLLDCTTVGLKDCPDFETASGYEFQQVLVLIFRFLSDRADIGKQSGGDIVKYLFEPTDGKQFTEDYLQRDLGQFLKGSPLRPQVRYEERDIAGGRADLTVKPNTHRFSIEIKRESVDASPEAIRSSYAGQASAYTAADAPLAALLVLDLTPHPNGAPGVFDSVWVDRVSVPGGTDRFVVVGVVRGNRKTPSATRVSKQQQQG
jgi:hypothetical protein